MNTTIAIQYHLSAVVHTICVKMKVTVLRIMMHIDSLKISLVTDYTYQEARRLSWKTTTCSQLYSGTAELGMLTSTKISSVVFAETANADAELFLRR